MLRVLTLLAVLIVWGGSPVLAQSKSQTPVVGTVATATDGKLEITTPNGNAVQVTLTDKTRYIYVSGVTLSDIHVGDYVGVGAAAGDGPHPAALEVTLFPESARGVGEGSGPWNQGPNSTMTNGTVSATTVASPASVTVTYGGSSQVFDVAEGTPMTTFKPTDKSALASGASVLARCTRLSDGGLIAVIVTIGTDGYVPKG